MKLDYYRSFIIKIYDLGLSFLPLYKAKRETLATLTTLKRTPGMSPTAWPLRPNPATRTSSFSSIKFKQPSSGTKGVIFFCHSWLAQPWHISWWQNLAVWLQLLFFPAQCPWQEKHHQKSWPPGLCPNGLSCAVIMPLLVSSAATELPGSTKTAILAHPAGATGLSERAMFLYIFWDAEIIL